MRNYRKYTDEQVGEAIERSFSWVETAVKLGLSKSGGSNNKTLKKIAEKYNFDYSHFKGQGWNLGGKANNTIPLNDLLKKGSLARSDTLKKKLIKNDILKNICSECGQLPFWNNKPLTLELDHIDGDNTNNELSNLRILCIHCHSQTPTFRGRKNNKNKNTKIKSKNNACKICNKKTYKNKYNLCKSCFVEQNVGRKVKDRPPKEQLFIEVKETSCCAVGRKYGVSDTTVRKWLK